jgi:hypothetical protein
MAGMPHYPSLLGNKNINTIKLYIQTECKLDTTDTSYPAFRHFLLSFTSGYRHCKNCFKV